MSDASIFARLAETLGDDWSVRARPEQLPPPGDWTTWIFLGGRGAGKTRAGAEWVNRLSASVGRIALIAPTAADARDVMIEGESGILATAPDWNRPTFEPSKRRVLWPNGCIATAFSSEEPSRLRGPQHGAAWCDELCAWSNADETWAMLQMGLRLGPHPRAFISTTPKPTKLLRSLVAREGNGVVITRASTFSNEANLPASFLQSIQAQYAGTRLGRQELNAELLEDVPGALWSRDTLDKARLPEGRMPDMRRVVVAVDPSDARGANDEGADSIGIVVAGLGVDGRGYVLDDVTCKDSPAGWGRRAVAAYYRWKADRVVAERNYGGAMCEHVIRTTDPNVPYKEVIASRGKIARCEPVAALFEQGRVSLAPGLADLEDQMCAMTSDGYVGGGSPDRVDALVWAITALMLEQASCRIIVEPLQI